MKRTVLLSLIVAIFSPMQVWAMGDETCNGKHYVYVRDSYEAVVNVGDYYFKSETSQLPLTIYYYPNDNDSSKAKAPVVYLDLTCTPSDYLDPNVEAMIEKAEKYHLSFPMEDNMTRLYNGDSTQMWYRITYDVNYRNMIYGEGVTYSIPAYVRLESKNDATIKIVSRSIATRCRDYVNTLPMNTSLRFTPDDSESVYLWQIGEWVNLQYRFLWQGAEPLTISYGNACEVALDNGFQTGKVTLPNDKFQWRRQDALDEMEETHQPDKYIRFYSEDEGILTIEEYKEVSTIREIQLAGVKAVIDTTGVEWIINAVLPAGTDKKNTLEAAYQNRYLLGSEDTSQDNYLIYELYGAAQLSVGDKRTYGSFKIGGKTYYTKGVAVSTSPGNTDATLLSVSIDGAPMDDFQSRTPLYNDVEVTTAAPVFSATATAATSQISITNPTSVPGTATITVTAEAGNTQTYTFNVIEGRSGDATLENIYLNGTPLSGFTPDQLYYREEVVRIPTVTAVATDPKSAVEVVPVKTLPGYSTIIVTAERGNQTKYSINFAMPTGLKACAMQTDTLLNDMQYAINAADEKVLLLPVRELSKDTVYMRLVWSGTQDLKIAVATYCDFSDNGIADNIIDTLTLTPDRAFDIIHYDLRPSDMKEYNSYSADGNVYLKVIASDNGVLQAEAWDEDCYTMSSDLVIGSSISLDKSSFADMYKVYVSDMTEKDIRFSWSGSEQLKIFVAKTCDFLLADNNRNVLKPAPFYLTAANSYHDVNAAQWATWQNRADDDFVYLRFVAQGEGTLTTTLLADHSKTTAVGEPLSSSFRVNGDYITSFEQQTISIYSVSGILLARLKVEANQTMRLPLTTAGIYIISSDVQTAKIIR